MLDSQTQISASGGGLTMAGNWYIGTSGLGSGGATPGTLNGPLTGNADTATHLKTAININGVGFDGSQAITVGLNTTSTATTGTYYVPFVSSNSAGNQQAYTNGNFSINPNSGTLSLGGAINATNLPSTSTIGASVSILANASVSGTNTGDQNLSGYLTTSTASATYAPLASPTFTGNVNVPNVLSGGVIKITNSGLGVPNGFQLVSATSSTVLWEQYLDSSNSFSIRYGLNGTNSRKLVLDANGNMTIGGSYYGDGSQLTGIPYPVTSVNGQTGAVTVSSPTKVSQLTNDSNFISSSVVILGSFNFTVDTPSMGFGQVASRYETGVTLPETYSAGYSTKNLFLAFQCTGGGGTGDTYGGGGPDFTKVWWGWQLSGPGTALTAQTFWSASPELMVSLYYDGDGQGSNLYSNENFTIYVCYLKE